MKLVSSPYTAFPYGTIITRCSAHVLRTADTIHTAGEQDVQGLTYTNTIEMNTSHVVIVFQ